MDHAAHPEGESTASHDIFDMRTTRHATNRLGSRDVALTSVRRFALSATQEFPLLKEEVIIAYLVVRCQRRTTAITAMDHFLA